MGCCFSSISDEDVSLFEYQSNFNITQNTNGDNLRFQKLNLTSNAIERKSFTLNSNNIEFGIENKRKNANNIIPVGKMINVKIYENDEKNKVVNNIDDIINLENHIFKRKNNGFKSNDFDPTETLIINDKERKFLSDYISTNNSDNNYKGKNNVNCEYKEDNEIMFESIKKILF